MNNFIEQIKSSIYSPNFYKKLENQPASFTIYYLLKFSILVALVGTIIISILFAIFQGNTLAKAGVANIEEFVISYVSNNFPESLVINFQDGILTTNSSSSISFPFPAGLEDQDATIFKNILTLNANEQISKNSFRSYDSMIVLSSTSGAIYDEQNERMQYFNFKDDNVNEIPNFLITKTSALESAEYYSNVLSSMLPYVYIFSAIFIFIFFIFWVFIGTLVFAIFSGFLAWILGKIWGVEHSYSVWYQKAVHADTLYIVLIWTLGWLLPLAYIPFLNTLIVLIILFVNSYPDTQ